MKARARSGFAIDGKRRRSVMSMAALIDFTFILLIFFMVVTQFDRFTPVDVTIRKTPMKAQPRPEPQDVKTEVLHLRVKADGFFELDGEEIGDIVGFTGVLAHHQPPEKEAAENKPLLLVEPDGDVSVQLLIDTMHALKALPGFRVRIVSKEDGAAPASGRDAFAPPVPGREVPAVDEANGGATDE